MEYDLETQPQPADTSQTQAEKPHNQMEVMLSQTTVPAPPAKTETPEDIDPPETPDAKQALTDRVAAIDVELAAAADNGDKDLVQLLNIEKRRLLRERKSL